MNRKRIQSRRDNTLLTVGFNLRQYGTYHQVPQGRHLAHEVPSLRDLGRGGLFRRLKPTVNKVSPLRGSVIHDFMSPLRGSEKDVSGIQSRRDNTLLTVGFNLRKAGPQYQVPQGRHFIDCTL